ncbi:MAG TPA: hypothetical protein VNG33_16350 [Polyangiaceae bacterium]|nr:hypothetical protein [Polyangiaceae bacterium]
MTKPSAMKPELVTAALLALVVLGAPRPSLAQTPAGTPPTPTGAPATAASTVTPTPASSTTQPPTPTPGPTVSATAEGAGGPPPLLGAPQATAEPSALQVRIKAATDKASDIKENVGSLRDRHTITDSQANAYERQIASWVSTLGALDEQAGLVEAQKQKAKAATAAVPPAVDAGGAPAAPTPAPTDVVQSYEKALNTQTALAEAGLAAITAQLTEVSNATGWNLVGTLLRARCATAICFDNGAKKDWLGIEPLVELPVGKSLALSKSSLSDYVDNHELRIDLAAGARVWLFRDVVSVSLYISKPLTDGRIRLEGSPFVYPAASFRRPYPGIAVGLLFDSLWLGFDRDELRNGDGQDAMAVNPDFPPNKVVSSTWTLTVALQPVTAFRTAIGTAVQATGRNSR